MFKSGAVRIEKCVQKENEPPISRERQSEAIQNVEANKANATETRKDGHDSRVRWLEMWLGATHESLEMLRQIYDKLIPQLVHDLEIQAGLGVMRRITADIIAKLEPIVHRYHESRIYGRGVCERLRKALFPMEDNKDNSYETLIVLQSLEMFLTYIDGHLTALSPASQALWDQEFVDAVSFAAQHIQRQKAWVTTHIKVKSPQTLLVPQRPPMEVDADRDEEAVGDVLVREFYY